MPSLPPAVFIVFEGGDGAGKSTQVGLLGDWLAEQGHDVVRTREPGGTPLGQAVRDVLLHGDHVDPRAEALLFAADRAHHVATLVRPALARGATVVSDRYLYSSVAYQGAGRQVDPREIRDLSLWAVDDLEPDLVVLLDLDPSLARDRVAQSAGGPDRLEREALAFHQAVREQFLGMAAADPDRFLVLDATTPVEDLQARIRERVGALTSVISR